MTLVMSTRKPQAVVRIFYYCICLIVGMDTYDIVAMKQNKKSKAFRLSPPPPRGRMYVAVLDYVFAARYMWMIMEFL